MVWLPAPGVPISKLNTRSAKVVFATSRDDASTRADIVLVIDQILRLFWIVMRCAEQKHNCPDQSVMWVSSRKWLRFQYDQAFYERAGGSNCGIFINSPPLSADWWATMPGTVNASASCTL